jgi:hypothetical protein
MSDDQQREAVVGYVPSVGDLRARHAAGMLALGYREGPGIDAQFDAALSALAPVQPCPLRAGVEALAAEYSSQGPTDLGPTLIGVGVAARLRALLAETEVHHG